MELEASRIKAVWKDAILVKALTEPEKAGRFFVPDSARQILRDRRKGHWRGEVIQIGMGVDQSVWKPHKVRVGDVVIIDPVALECPTFSQVDGGEIVKFIFIRQEDILAKEEKIAVPTPAAPLEAPTHA